MSKRVLIVEDSELNRDLLVQILEGTYDLEVVADGEAAVRAASASVPDLILMDIGLPGISGLDAAREIKRDPRLGSVPIVAVSSHVMPGDRVLALEAGCTEFVAKPIDDVALLALLDRMIGA